LAVAQVLSIHFPTAIAQLLIDERSGLGFIEVYSFGCSFTTFNDCRSLLGGGVLIGYLGIGDYFF
jgi:hypothetical protein